MLHAGPAGVLGVVGHLLAGPDFPILSSVEVPVGATTVHLSAAGAPVADKSAPPRTVQAYGDKATRTEATLLAIHRTLVGLGLGMGDVVKTTVFLVGDPGTGGRMDFDVWVGSRLSPRLALHSTF